MLQEKDKAHGLESYLHLCILARSSTEEFLSQSIMIPEPDIRAEKELQEI